MYEPLPIQMPDTLGSTIDAFGNPVPFGSNWNLDPLEGASAGSSPVRPDFLSMDSFLGGTNADGSRFNGWGPTALNTFTGLANTFLGMRQYGLAKSALRENRRQFNANFDSQRTLTNSRLRDRQRARVASNPNAYESVGNYMAQNGI